MEVAIAVVGVFAILVGSELLWRLKLVRGEVARKLIHISVGSFVAFWPYFMSWRMILLMSLAFLFVVSLSKRHGIFRSVHSVARKTQGEIFFPIGIGLAALIQPTPIIFTAAMLHLSLADGLAAIVGRKYGLLHQYKIRNYTKTLAGSATFYLTSTIIILATFLLSGTSVSWPLVPLLIWLPFAATVMENLAVGGIDNVLVPLLIILVLQAVRVS